MRFSRFLAIVAMLLLASVSVFAQSATTGALTGTITSDGAPLPGALITVTSPQLQGSRTAYSDANGNYNLTALPGGDYTIRVSLEGLQEVTRSSRVSVAGTARVDVDLKEQVGKEIFIRLVDDRSGPWGHVNFDEFLFHERKPDVAAAEALKLSAPPPPVDEVKYAGLSPADAVKAMTLPPGARKSSKIRKFIN